MHEACRAIQKVWERVPGSIDIVLGQCESSSLGEESCRLGMVVMRKVSGSRCDHVSGLGRCGSGSVSCRFCGVTAFLSPHQVKEFDSISRLDQWLTTMLLRIKKSIPGDGDGDGDLK